MAEQNRWVRCPICSEPDMEFRIESADDGGRGYISCTNLVCPSNIPPNMLSGQSLAFETLFPGGKGWEPKPGRRWRCGYRYYEEEAHSEIVKVKGCGPVADYLEVTLSDPTPKGWFIGQPIAELELIGTPEEYLMPSQPTITVPAVRAIVDTMPHLLHSPIQSDDKGVQIIIAYEAELSRLLTKIESHQRGKESTINALCEKLGPEFEKKLQQARREGRREAMNEAVKRAVKAELSNVEDNLMRYKHMGKPTDITGNGETYASIIQKLEIQRGELRDALSEQTP